MKNCSLSATNTHRTRVLVCKRWPIIKTWKRCEKWTSKYLLEWELWSDSSRTFKFSNILGVVQNLFSNVEIIFLPWGKSCDAFWIYSLRGWQSSLFILCFSINYRSSHSRKKITKLGHYWSTYICFSRQVIGGKPRRENKKCFRQRCVAATDCHKRNKNLIKKWANKKLVKIKIWFENFMVDVRLVLITRTIIMATIARKKIIMIVVIIIPKMAIIKYNYRLWRYWRFKCGPSKCQQFFFFFPSLLFIQLFFLCFLTKNGVRSTR